MAFTKLSKSCQIPGLNKLFQAYFPGIEHGVFVEVGANDGYSWSNTWGLAEIGWRGLYFEPVKELADRCREVHSKNNVQVQQVAVGEFNGFTKLYPGAGATTSPKVAADNTFFYGNSLDKFTVIEAVSLNTSLQEQQIPANFELLVIDVDGDELGVLHGLDLDHWKPKMVIIEANKLHPLEGWRFNAAEIDCILSQWYEEVYADHINSIYLRRAGARKEKTMASLFESKRDTLLKYAGEYGCKLLLETGTGAGDMLAAIYPYFKKCFSIELSLSLYQHAVMRFKRMPTIKIFQGDSGEVIKDVIPLLTEPTLIYLDAHYCGQGTARGKEETPIQEELETLLFDPKFKHVILIDDLKDFTKNPAYPKVEALQAFITAIRHDLLFEIVKEGGGMLLIAPAKKKRVAGRKVQQIVPVEIEGDAVAVEEKKEQVEHRPAQNFARAPILYGPYRNPPKEDK